MTDEERAIRLETEEAQASRSNLNHQTRNLDTTVDQVIKLCNDRSGEGVAVYRKVNPVRYALCFYRLVDPKGPTSGANLSFYTIWPMSRDMVQLLRDSLKDMP